MYYAISLCLFLLIVVLVFQLLTCVAYLKNWTQKAPSNFLKTLRYVVKTQEYLCYKCLFSL